MGPHEWIMVGLFVVAAGVAGVEIRKSKRPRPEPAAVATGPSAPRSRHVLLVGHQAVTRVSIRRALEQYMGVSEVRSGTDGLERLAEVAGPDVEVTVVVDLTGEQGDTGDFVARVLGEEREPPVRLLVVTPESGGRAAVPEGARIEYLPQPQSILTLLAAIRRSDELDDRV